MNPKPQFSHENWIITDCLLGGPDRYNSSRLGFDGNCSKAPKNPNTNVGTSISRSEISFTMTYNAGPGKQKLQSEHCKMLKWWRRLPGIIKWCNSHPLNVHISMCLWYHRNLSTFSHLGCVPNHHHLAGKTPSNTPTTNVCTEICGTRL